MGCTFRGDGRLRDRTGTHGFGEARLETTERGAEAFPLLQRPPRRCREWYRTPAPGRQHATLGRHAPRLHRSRLPRRRRRGRGRPVADRHDERGPEVAPRRSWTTPAEYSAAARPRSTWRWPSGEARRSSSTSGRRGADRAASNFRSSNGWRSALTARSRFSASTRATTAATPRASSKEFPVPYDSVEDPSEKISREIGAPKNYPITLFYDAQGKRSYIHQGGYNDEAGLLKDIERYAL